MNIHEGEVNKTMNRFINNKEFKKIKTFFGKITYKFNGPNMKRNLVYFVFNLIDPEKENVIEQ